MAILNVEAIAEDGLAGAGNLYPLQFVVSVTNIHGLAVTGLVSSNFKIALMLGHIKTSSLNVISKKDGCYLIQVSPAAEWIQGVYVFCVTVTRSASAHADSCLLPNKFQAQTPKVKPASLPDSLLAGFELNNILHAAPSLADCSK